MTKWRLILDKLFINVVFICLAVECVETRVDLMIVLVIVACAGAACGCTFRTAVQCCRSPSGRPTEASPSPPASSSSPRSSTGESSLWCCVFVSCRKWPYVWPERYISINYSSSPGIIVVVVDLVVFVTTYFNTVLGKKVFTWTETYWLIVAHLWVSASQTLLAAVGWGR